MGTSRAVQCLTSGIVAPKLTHFTPHLQLFSNIALSESMSQNIHTGRYLGHISSSEPVIMRHAPIRQARIVGHTWADSAFTLPTLSVLADFDPPGRCCKRAKKSTCAVLFTTRPRCNGSLPHFTGTIVWTVSGALMLRSRSSGRYRDFL